ncbi:MAG: DUF1848 domain-containing protein [Bacteroidales bacterium]|nr:DUF1848 domain-containing protein [Bacteroidales bacterium]
MAWKKEQIVIEDGRTVDAQAPEIVSASRSTDIPAFYADWFFHRLEKGYSAWTNPFNGVKSYVSYNKTRFIVFWSKNPKPLLNHLDVLDKKGIGCYVQFSLNDYEQEALELNVPPLGERIETFKTLSERLGKDGVIWRFDPLILTDKISIDDLLKKVENIGNQIHEYTDKLVFSFADITSYKKVKANLEKSSINYHEWQEDEMLKFTEALSKMNKANGWNLQLATCGEKVSLEQFGVEHNHCVDDRLIVKRAWKDATLMKFLGAEVHEIQNSLFGMEPVPENAISLDDTHYAVIEKNNRDTGQRMLCGCMVSKDIGQYNTCIHRCEYCYANDNKAIAQRNYEDHVKNPKSETITGR